MTGPDIQAFSNGYFMPHGDSYGPAPGVLWMNAIPDLLIATACITLPLVLLYVARRRRDLPGRLIAWFSVFIVACGATYALDVWSVWHTQYLAAGYWPAGYWAAGLLKLITAAAVLPITLLLWRSIPQLLALPSQRQLREANESLARATRELEAFTASVSHDLRSPLTTIAGQAGLLELSLESTTDDQKRRLQRIQGSVRRMSELIDALLALSRIARHSLQRELVDVSALSQEVIADLRQQYPTRDVDVTVQPGIYVHGDRRLLCDLLDNLLGNAWKFTAKTSHPRIDIGRACSGSLATICIRDNGVGFDMAYQRKLFQPFQRLHGPGEFAGSGVGLATVARIVERHGGRIWAEAKPNDGAVFYFTLPTTPITQNMMLSKQAMT